MPTLLVASDQSGAGKTALCAGLAAELRRNGRSVSVLKPFAGENGPHPDADAQALAQLLGEPMPGEPVRVGPDGLPSGALQAAAEARDRALDGRDVVVVEGSSALSEAATAAAADALDASVVLVTGSRPDVDASTLEAWRSALGGPAPGRGRQRPHALSGARHSQQAGPGDTLAGHRHAGRHPGGPQPALRDGRRHRLPPGRAVHPERGRRRRTCRAHHDRRHGDGLRNALLQPAPEQGGGRQGRSSRHSDGRPGHAHGLYGSDHGHPAHRVRAERGRAGGSAR